MVFNIPRRFPLPRRSLKSAVFFLLLPFLFFSSLYSLSSPSSSRAPLVERGRKMWETAGVRGMLYPTARAAVGGKAGKGGRGGGGKGKGKAKEGEEGRHVYRKDGLLEVNKEGRHPIYDLISDGKKAWAKKVSSQSRTLPAAIKEYRRRYNRAPPKGFDKWFDYVISNDIILTDEYDQIFRDLEPFHALPPSHLRSIQSTWESLPGTYILTIPSTLPPTSPPGPSIAGQKVFSPPKGHTGAYLSQTTFLGNELEFVSGKERAKTHLELLREIEGDLRGILGEAGQEDLRVTFYAHDVPFQFVGHEYRSELEDAASLAEFINPEEHMHDLAHLGWASACAPNRPLREAYDPDVLPDIEGLWDVDREKSLIWDHTASMDPCLHPELTHITGFLSSHGKGPVPLKDLYPILAMCTTRLHSDVLAVAMEQFTEDVGEDPEWKDKMDERMLWRGSNTGILFEDGVPWNISQRVRIVAQADSHTGYIPLLLPTPQDLAIGTPELTPVDELNRRLMDVGFVGQPIQCDAEVCEELKGMFEFRKTQGWEQANRYKYIFDIDGNGWSARFKRLMSTNSLILKSTIFPEWYADRIQPWVHYVPIKADLSDIYDVLTFFRGTKPNGEDGHDDLANEIAKAGKTWSLGMWRKEDMVAYQFRLYLEYARLMAPNRSKMDFQI